MKTVKNSLLQRRSIRRYERQAINEDDMHFIHDAIINTPTSYNGQQFSVIDVSDQELKEQLYEITQQKQIKTCNRFLIFCADYNKIRQGAKAKNRTMPDFEKTGDGVIVGIVDASLAMMNALIAAESCGLGTCCIGYTRTAAPEKINKLLKLPQGVFVVCGLAIGIPREFPDLKPKQSSKMLIHNNTYDNDIISSEIIKYDALVSAFNVSRSGNKSQNDWVNHIIDYYETAMNYNMLEALRAQGFDVKK